MKSFVETFSKRPAFLAVIHVETDQQAVRNVRVARDGGADGVFLINHGVSSHILNRAYRTVRLDNPQMWIGLNMLDLDTSDAAKSLPPGAQGWWADNPGLLNDEKDPCAMLKEVDAIRRDNPSRKPEQVYFGGVSFKGQGNTDDIRTAAQDAYVVTPYVDVVTTTGAQTGTPPSIEKIKRMRSAIGDHPLAIASGMTPENVGPFCPYVDAFLVASGISRTFTELDPFKVQAFAKAIGR